jgi:hypothetical protein
MNTDLDSACVSRVRHSDGIAARTYPGDAKLARIGNAYHH